MKEPVREKTFRRECFSIVTRAFYSAERAADDVEDYFTRGIFLKLQNTSYKDDSIYQKKYEKGEYSANTVISISKSGQYQSQSKDSTTNKEQLGLFDGKMPIVTISPNRIDASNALLSMFQRKDC